MALFGKNKNVAIQQTPGKNRLTLAEIAQTGGSLRIRDISNNLWFPAGQPVHPVSPRGTPPRRYPFQPLTNYNWSGRDGAIDFGTLRRFSCYSIVRAIIESVLDRLCSEKWEFRLIATDDQSKSDYKKKNATDPRIKALKQFFRKPDGWQNFRTWSRGLYDDMLVIDAASVWLQRDQKEKIASLVQIDGATVFPLLDETGQQPDPGRVLAQTASAKATRSYLDKVKSGGGSLKLPAKIIGSSTQGTIGVENGSPAFQLTPYGFPAQEMTANELVYAVRNRKTYKKYGFSIVEQALSIIALGLARQDFQAAYYTSGNVPEFIAFLPPDCPVSKAEELNGYLDSILTGQLSNRRKGFFLPSYGSEKSPNIVFPKANDEVLKDAFDEWIARVLCYFFGMSPTAFIKQVNRATAQQQSEDSEEQGLQPYIDWMGDTINEIVQCQFGFTDIEAVTQTREEQDALKQAQIDDLRVRNGSKTLNDLREANGDDPYDIPEASIPMVYTAMGAVPIGVDHQVDQQQTKITAGVAPDPNAPPEPPNGKQNPPGGGKGGPSAPGGKRPPKGGGARKAAAEELASHDIDPEDSRHNWPELSPGILTEKSHAARVRTEVALRKAFRAAKAKVLWGVNGLIARPVRKVRKVRQFDSVQFNLDQEDSGMVLAIDIMPTDWAPKGRESQPHVTVLFGLHEQPIADINAVTSGIGDVEITLGDFFAFREGPDGVPIVIEVESEKLHELHDKLARLPHTDTHPEYKPHITVGYLKPGCAERYVQQGNPLKGMKFFLSDLVFSGKDKTTVALQKAMGDESPSDEDNNTIDEITDILYIEAEPYFEHLASELATPYEESALSGVLHGALQLDLSDAGILTSMNHQASEWARDRAAELVGMKRDLEGNLIQNPDAHWAITETTRQDLRDIVADAFMGNTNWQDFTTNIKGALENSFTFSDSRAEMIARTEIGRSQMGSAFNVWRKSGLVTRLLWEAVGENPCPLCLMNDQQEVELGKQFPSGATSTLDSHPQCQCLVRAVGFAS